MMSKVKTSCYTKCAKWSAGFVASFYLIAAGESMKQSGIKSAVVMEGCGALVFCPYCDDAPDCASPSL